MSPSSPLRRRVITTLAERLAPLAFPLSFAAVTAASLLLESKARRAETTSDMGASQRPAAPMSQAAPTAPPAQLSPSAEDAPPVSLWRASSPGAWRLPNVGHQVVIVDADRAVMRLLHNNQLLLVDLTTGAVSPPLRVFPEESDIDHLVRVGSRVLAFGSEDDRPAVWRLEWSSDPVAPLSAVKLAAPTGPLGSTTTLSTAVAVSPDQRQLVWCSGLGPPTLRDAASLRVLRVLRVASCFETTFLTAARVRFDDQEVHLLTGAVKEHDSSRVLRAGPAGSVLASRADRFGPVTVTRRGEVVQQPFELDGDVRWTPDGVAIALNRESLTLRPRADGVSRTVRPRLGREAYRTFDVDERRALILCGATLELIDLETGESQTAEGNLSQVQDAVPLAGDGPSAGGVVTAGDSLRAWSAAMRPDAKASISREEIDPDIVALRPAGDDVLLLDGYERLWRWDPASGTRRFLGKPRRFGAPVVASAGDDVWFGAELSVERAIGGEPARSVARYRHGLELVAIQPLGRSGPRAQLVWHEPDVTLADNRQAGALLHFADLERGAAYAWPLTAGCTPVPEGLAAGRVVLQELLSLHALSVSGGLPLSVKLPGLADAPPTVSPGGEVAIVVDGALLLWRPDARLLSSFPLGLPDAAEVTSLRYSADGAHLAIGTSSGEAILVAAAEARSRGAALPVRDPYEPCVVGTTLPSSFARLGLTVNPAAQ